jgi:hypothetical protein
LKYDKGVQTSSFIETILNPFRDSSQHEPIHTEYIYRKLNPWGVYVLALIDEGQSRHRIGDCVTDPSVCSWSSICFNTVTERFMRFRYECPDKSFDFNKPMDRLAPTLSSATLWTEVLILQFTTPMNDFFQILQICEVGEVEIGSNCQKGWEVFEGSVPRRVFLDEGLFILVDGNRLIMSAPKRCPYRGWGGLETSIVALP